MTTTSGCNAVLVRKGSEGVLKLDEDQEVSRKGAKIRKEFFANLSAFATLRETLHFFTASQPFRTAARQSRWTRPQACSPSLGLN